MFSLTTTTPHKGPIKSIVVKYPVSRLGNIVDVYGNEWNINGIHNIDGKPSVWACPVNELHKYYTDTSGSSYGGQIISQKWEPYFVEIVDETVGISGEAGNRHE